MLVRASQYKHLTRELSKLVESNMNVILLQVDYSCFPKD